MKRYWGERDFQKKIIANIRFPFFQALGTDNEEMIDETETGTSLTPGEIPRGTGTPTTVREYSPGSQVESVGWRQFVKNNNGADITVVMGDPLTSGTCISRELALTSLEMKKRIRDG